MHPMSTTKAIADDYYINRFSNAEIFVKHGLERRKLSFMQERVFEHLPSYKHRELNCEYCNGEMESSFLGKNAGLAQEDFSVPSDSKELDQLVLTEVNDNYERSSWRRDGVAYEVEGDYRVTTPLCATCGHQLNKACTCESCVTLKAQRAIEAAEVTYNKLISIEKITIDELSCGQMLPLFINLSGLIASLAHSNFSAAFEELDFEQKVTLMLIGGAVPIKASVFPATRMLTRTEYSVAWDSISFEFQGGDQINQILTQLKLKALNQSNTQSGALNVLEIWESLAQEEALSVLEYYCHAHDINYSPGAQTIEAIKRSLNRYGLALTARYIYHSVWRARKYASENNFNRFRAFSFIYGNLNFWIEDPRARTYKADPFRRTEKLLAESDTVAVFSSFFLERNGISYFTDSISMVSILRG